MKKLNLIILISLIFVNVNSQTIRIKAVGDIMLGSITPVKKLPKSHTVFPNAIANQLDEADITFGNLEGVFINRAVKPQKCSEASRKAKRCYEFGMPDTLSIALKKMHFNVVSMDNNHNSDYGYNGVNHTKATLDKLNIKYAAKKSPTILTLEGKKIGVIAFGHSGTSYHVSNLTNTTKVIQELDKKCDLVIVSFHGGAEGFSAQHIYNKTEKYYGENRGNLIKFAHTAVDAGADLIIGHGPHVLRGIELYKNKLIMYSLGNFLTHGNVSLSGVKGIGAIMDIEINENTGDFEKGKIISSKQLGMGIPHLDTTNQSASVIKKLSQSDFPNSPLKINPEGYISK